MQIVKMDDYSMVIMKDSDDPPWISVGDIYRRASKYRKNISVDVGDQLTIHYLESSDYIYSAGRLILYFKSIIPPKFQLHNKVYLTTI